MSCLILCGVRLGLALQETDMLHSAVPWSAHYDHPDSECPGILDASGQQVLPDGVMSERDVLHVINCVNLCIGIDFYIPPDSQPAHCIKCGNGIGHQFGDGLCHRCAHLLAWVPGGNT